MIHVATVHWKSDKWIDLQLRYLHLNLPRPFRTYAFLNEVPEHHRAKFDYTSTEPIVEHGIKLNILADIISFNAQSDDDQVIFIDGDAFPVVDLTAFLDSPLLRTRQLAAIQRLENAGDRQPHPSFCVTNIGLWRRIRGDWKRGYQWVDSFGAKVSDVGGNLLKILEDHGIDWYPLLRTSGNDMHPLLGNIYGGLIYHHCNGFYRGTGRVLKTPAQIAAHRSFRGRLLALVPSRGLGLKLKRRFHPTYTATERVREQTAAVNDLLFEKLSTDEAYFRRLLENPVQER